MFRSVSESSVDRGAHDGETTFAVSVGNHGNGALPPDLSLGIDQTSRNLRAAYIYTYEERFSAGRLICNQLICTCNRHERLDPHGIELLNGIVRSPRIIPLKRLNTEGNSQFGLSFTLLNKIDLFLC